MSVLELDPTLLQALRTLAQHDVELVVVGDVAAAIHSEGGFVAGLAIVPASYGRNARRLAGALEAMDAEPDDAGTPPPAGVDLRRIDLREIAPCSFVTRYVDVAVDFEPPGTGGYRDLIDDACNVALAGGVRPLVAAPDDLRRIARAGGGGLPYAQAPRVLPPEPGAGCWPAEEIRAGRPTRT